MFGEAHAAVREDESPYPVTGTDHRGLGGCSTHDTRITFQPTRDKINEFAAAMGWSQLQIYKYYQAALNMIPVENAIPEKEEFYDDVIHALTSTDFSSHPLKRLNGDTFDTNIVVDSVAQHSVAMFSDENRWSSALLLKDEVRPSNLKILTNVIADRVIFSSDEKNDELSVVGLIVRSEKTNEERMIKVNSKGLLAITAGAIGTPSLLQRSGVGPSEALESLGINVIVQNDEVGHGVDHIEIGLLYDWMPGLNVPRGGVMGWPISLFLSTPPDDSTSQHGTHKRNSFVQCHFGAGCAEPYTNDTAVVCTPSCIEPDHDAGFRIRLISKDPQRAVELVHADQTADLNALYNGLVRASEVCRPLQTAGLAGRRISPPESINLHNKSTVLDWIRDNHFTVFHWACTCPAGVYGRVADQYFRVRINRGVTTPSDVIKNLFVGSAASLPDLPEANPHLTVSAFSFALAESMLNEICNRQGLLPFEPEELRAARLILQNSNNNMTLTTVSPTNEKPSLSAVATLHQKEWLERNNY